MQKIKVDSRVYDKAVITEYKVQRLFNYLMTKLPNQVENYANYQKEFNIIYPDKEVGKLFPIDLKEIDEIMDWHINDFALELLKDQKDSKGE